MTLLGSICILILSGAYSVGLTIAGRLDVCRHQENENTPEHPSYILG
jgi:hypothetical protein